MNIARRNRERKLAALQGAVDPSLNARASNQYDLMLMQLAEHRRRLKQVQSIQRKAEAKAKFLPDYQAYVDGVLASGSGRQDDVLMTIMIWHIDAGQLDRALTLAKYALEHDLQTPDRYDRKTACLIAEEVADAAARAPETDPVASSTLLRAVAMTESHDMFDQVRAKLNKATGIALSNEGQPQEAIHYLKRALELDDRSGVKKLIEQIERQLRKEQTAQPAD